MAGKSGAAQGPITPGGTIRVTLARSTIGALPKQRATVRSLGLRKIGSSVEHEATGAVLGMVRAVAHLVRVEEASHA